MRNLVTAAGITLAACFAAGTGAAADASGKYFALHGGVSLVSDARVAASGNNLLGVLGGGGDLESDPGFSIVGAFGYKFPIGLRLEAEGSYRRNGLGAFDGTITIGGAPAFVSGQAKGSISGLGFMANAWWDLPLGRFLPYLGGGAGIVRLTADVRDESDTLQLIDDSVWVLAWQAGGGLGYEVQTGVVVSLDYRWYAAADPEFEVEFGGRADAEYASHNIMVGLRAHF